MKHFSPKFFKAGVICACVYLLSCNSSDFSFLGCDKSTEPQSDCGELKHVALVKHITVQDPSFYLETPFANSSSSCAAHFHLFFTMADYQRTLIDSTADQVPINLSHAFQVKATDGAGGYFPQTTDWAIGPWPQNPKANFQVDFFDHNSNTSLKSKYFITFGLNSTNPADSVLVSATIDYYP